MKTNIAQLCYVVAKMTISLNSPIVILVQTNATKTHYAATKMITNFNNKTFAAVETS